MNFREGFSERFARMSLSAKSVVSFTLNGEPVEVTVSTGRYLVDVLREDLSMMGTKRSCDQGVCGTCSVLLNGRLVSSCLTLAVRAEGAEVTTIEGLGSLEEGLHPLQESFASHGATQCGYCTPGMIVSAVALLEENPDPSEEEIKHWLTGNLCRCTGYQKIIDAIRAVAEGRTEPGPEAEVEIVKAYEE
jgi:carbon-monoxide dehydrogenase small subunit